RQALMDGRTWPTALPSVYLFSKQQITDTWQNKTRPEVWVRSCAGDGLFRALAMISGSKKSRNSSSPDPTSIRIPEPGAVCPFALAVPMPHRRTSRISKSFEHEPINHRPWRQDSAERYTQCCTNTCLASSQSPQPHSVLLMQALTLLHISYASTRPFLALRILKAQ
ncbi:hypothetical protein FRC19_003640, partial [Serendipita sp. 401]